MEIILDDTNATAYIKNSNTKTTIVTTSDKEVPNEAMVVAEYKDGRLIGACPSMGEKIINRNEFLSSSYERKDATSEIYMIVSGNEAKVNKVK